ncbi:MAG: hypothetical protein M3439_13225 [Chloroflexota bacterium]|nr:hypothetical protein [Chloroflexota bacterium]
MRQIMYAMQFRGEAASAGEGVLRAATSSPSTQIMSSVDSSGVTGQIDALDGGRATFTSEVRMTGDATFTETGTISFGDANRFDFSTIGEGHIGASPASGVSHGSVMWRIDHGTGQFAGATGTITSNFTLSEQGEVTDCHFGVIWLA